MEGLSYDEYFIKIDELAEQMREHWHAEQRVRALKIVIQLVKLLAESQQLKLYSRKYKLITKILDGFGQLVYQRIHKLEMEVENQHGGHELARDTCKNWFLKVASIRELVPRFYVELAILKACDILLHNKKNEGGQQLGNKSKIIEWQFYAQSLRRLTKAAWGIGDPIVALHARQYLCRVAANQLICRPREQPHSATLLPDQYDQNSNDSNVIGNLYELISMNTEACVVLIYHFDTTAIARGLSEQNIDLSAYFDLISGPLRSIIGIVAGHYDDIYNTLHDDDHDHHRKLVEHQLGLSTRSTNRGTQSDHFYLGTAGCQEALEMAKNRLELLLKCHLDGVSRSNCNFLAQNLLLYSACRNLPADIVADNGRQLLGLFKSIHGNQPWKCNPTTTTTTVAKPTGPQTIVDDNNQGVPHKQRDSLEQMLSHTHYSSIASFLIALDGSDKFETSHDDLKEPILLSLSEMIENILAVNLYEMDTDYLRCFKSLISYANHYTNLKLVDELLTKFVARLDRNRRYASSNHGHLLDIVRVLITNGTKLVDFAGILCKKSFSKLLELFRKDEHKLEVTRWILETMRANLKLYNKSTTTTTTNDESTTPTTATISDKETINHLLRLIGTINDSMSALIASDDVENLSELVNFFLDMIHIENHEEQLDFLSRCRSLTGNLNLTIEYLIKRVLGLPGQYGKSKKRKKQMKQNFLNGCLAYAFITIPAIHEPYSRLSLYVVGSRMALEHMSLSLADYYMKQIMLNLFEQTTITETSMNMSNEKQQQQQQTFSITNQTHGDHNQRSAQSMRLNKKLVGVVGEILELIVKHQEHIDLKHKLAMVDLIRQSFSDCPNLLLASKLLRLGINEDAFVSPERIID